MAKTFYGYAERDADSQLNWAKIGKDFSDMLSEEAKKREELKDELDAQTTESSDVLKETPMGNHEGVNTWILDYSGDAQEQLLMLERELKAGRLKPKDFTKQRERLTTGTQQLYEIVDGYQKEYDSKLTRYQNGDSGDFEGVMMESIEAMSNFTKYKPTINPATGEVMVAKRLKDKDGNYGVAISDDPNDIASTQILLGRITQNYDKYDLLKNANVLGARYGKYKKVIGKGNITTTTDARLFEQFEKSLSDDVDGILTNGYYGASILSDYLDVNPETGELYYYTADKNDKNPNAVHYEYKGNGKTPSFNLTTEQMGAAKDAYVSAVKASLSRDEVYKAPAPSRYTPTSYKEKTDSDEMLRLFNLTKQFIESPSNELLTAINQYGGGAISFERDSGDNKLIITGSDGATQELVLNDDGSGGQANKITATPAYIQEVLFMSQVGGNRAAARIFEKNKRRTAGSVGTNLTSQNYKAKITRPTKTVKPTEMPFKEKENYKRFSKRYSDLQTELDKISMGAEQYADMDGMKKNVMVASIMKQMKSLENKMGGTGTAAGDDILK